MMKFTFCIAILLSCRCLFSQSPGDFQSHQSGNWNATTTWERWDGTSWINPAPGVPVTSSGVITILSNHAITVTATTSADQVIVHHGGMIDINPNRTLTIAGAGVNLTIAGTVSVGGTLTTTTGTTMVSSGGVLVRRQGGTINSPTTANLSFMAGAVFEHQMNSPSAALTPATFDVASTLLIDGFTGTGTFSSANWNVPLGNVVYDCPNQASGIVNFAGLLRNVRGNLEVRNTGSSGRIYFNSSDSSTMANSRFLSIGGSFSISGSSRVFLTSTGLVELYVNGDFLFRPSSISPASQCATTGKGIMQVEGDAILSSGIWDFASGSLGIGVFVIKKNCYTSGAVVTKSGSGNSQGAIIFRGASGLQAFDPVGISGTATEIEIDNPSDVYLSHDLTMAGALTLKNGKLILPDIVLTLNGSIYQTTGNIASDSNATPTLIIGGTGLLPEDLAIEPGSVFTSIEMNRPSGTLTVNSDLSIIKELAINSGAWISKGTVHFSGDAALSGGGGKHFNSISIAVGGSLASTGDLQINGNLINDGAVILTAGLIVFGGSSTTISGSGLFAFYAASIDSGAAVNAAAPIQIQSTTTINGSLAINNGLVCAGTVIVSSTGTFIGNNVAVSVHGTLTVSSGGIFATDQEADLIIYGNLSINGELTALSKTSFAGVTTMTGTGSKSFNGVNITGSLTPNGAYIISGDLTLSGNGTLNPGNNTTTFNGTNTFFTNTGTGTATFFRTTISAGAKLTSNSLLVANNTFTARGTFFCNAGFKGLGAVRVSPTTGVFIASNSPIAIKGTFTVSSQATFTANTDADVILAGNVSVTGTLNVLSTVTFDGTTTMTGSGGKFFKDLIITGTLTPNSAYKISGDVNVQGVLNPGNNSVTFLGATSFYGSGSISINNCTISANAMLTSSSGNVIITGNLVNDGIFTPNGGTVTFSGNSTKVISSSITKAPPIDFYDIILEGGTTTTDLISELDINLWGELSVTTALDSANFDVDGAADNRIFTLRSIGDNPAVDASIGSLPSKALVTGKIVVQRFISGEGRVYRFLCSPVVGSSVAEWQKCFPITGKFADPSDPGIICGKKVLPTNPSLYYYDESLKDYAPFPTLGPAMSNVLDPGRGYAAFIRECNNPTVISVTGVLTEGINRGSVNLQVTNTVPVSDYNNLVGNPYPSAIRWDSVQIEGVSATIAVRDSGQGTFKYYTQGGLGAPQGILVQGQAFWIRATGATPSITIKENSKTKSQPSDENIFYKRRPPDVLEVTLSGSTQTQTDIAYVAQTPGSSASAIELDAYDAPKMNNQLDDPATELFDLFTSVSVGGRPLALNAVPEITCGTRIILSVKDGGEGNYTFGFKRSGVFSDLSLMLLDRFEGLAFALADETYSFSITSDSSSRSLYRFELIFEEKGTNLNLPVQVDSMSCVDRWAGIKVIGPQLGIQYAVLIGGRGVSDTLEGVGHILFRIAPTFLQDGVNVASIYAFSHCNFFALNNTVEIWKYPRYIALVKDDPHCQAGVVLLQASGAPEGWEYRWYHALTDSVSFYRGPVLTTPELSKSRTYFVSAIDSLGRCEGKRSEAIARIIKYKDAKITVEGEATLVSNYLFGNHWYLNEVLLPDSSYRIPIRDSGIYKLLVGIDLCTTEDERKVDVSNVQNWNELKVFPNPVTEFLHLEFEAKNNNILGIALLDSSGNELEELKIKGPTGRGQIDFSNYPDGVYFIRVQTQELRYLKIVKR